MSKSIMKKIIYGIMMLWMSNIALCNTELCNAESCSSNYVIDHNISKIVIDTTKLLKQTNEDYLRANPEKVDLTLKKMYEPRKDITPSFVVLHYTVITTIEQTVDIYYARGVSAHFTIDRNGAAYKHINYDKDVAYHAGLSFWRGKYHLNYHSVGIEQINTGSDVNKEQSPFKEADDKAWETWPKEQLESTVELVKLLTKQYDIKPWNIIGHSDCSSGRKIDPGPLFPWKKLHDEYHVGFWPDEDSTITKELADELNHEDYMYLLHTIGYPIHGFIPSVKNIEELDEERKKNMKIMDDNLIDDATISAFQYHYMQDKFEADSTYRAGTLDSSTKIMILRCLKSIIKSVDDNYSLKMLKKTGDNNPSDAVKKVVDGFLTASTT